MPDAPDQTPPAPPPATEAPPPFEPDLNLITDMERSPKTDLSRRQRAEPRPDQSA